jgi:hypothetical protein
MRIFWAPEVSGVLKFFLKTWKVVDLAIEGPNFQFMGKKSLVVEVRPVRSTTQHFLKNMVLVRSKPCLKVWIPEVP